MNKNSPNVSIIIVSWNVKDFLSECLKSVVRHTKGTSYEIIVVDNASHDESVSMIKREFPEVRLIENTTNKGFGAANNQGIRIARGQEIVFLNPDTKLVSDVISTLLKEKNKSGAMLIGPEQINGKGLVVSNVSKLNTLVAFAAFLENLLSPIRRSDHRIIFKSLVPVKILNAAFWLISKDDFEKIGMFDENLFLYGEEMDVCNRISRAKGRTLLDRREYIIHYKGQSSKHVPMEHGFHAVFSTISVFKKIFLRNESKNERN